MPSVHTPVLLKVRHFPSKSLCSFLVKGGSRFSNLAKAARSAFTTWSPGPGCLERKDRSIGRVRVLWPHLSPELSVSRAQPGTLQKVPETWWLGNHFWKDRVVELGVGRAWLCPTTTMACSPIHLSASHSHSPGGVKGLRAPTKGALLMRCQ